MSERCTNPDEAFKMTTRAIGQTQEDIQVASTSCRIVSREQLKSEVKAAGFRIERISCEENPEYGKTLCARLSRS